MRSTRGHNSREAGPAAARSSALFRTARRMTWRRVDRAAPYALRTEPTPRRDRHRDPPTSGSSRKDRSRRSPPAPRNTFRTTGRAGGRHCSLPNSFPVPLSRETSSLVREGVTLEATACAARTSPRRCRGSFPSTRALRSPRAHSAVRGRRSERMPRTDRSQRRIEFSLSFRCRASKL